MHKSLRTRSKSIFWSCSYSLRKKSISLLCLSYRKSWLRRRYLMRSTETKNLNQPQNSKNRMSGTGKKQKNSSQSLKRLHKAITNWQVSLSNKERPCLRLISQHNVSHKKSFSLKCNRCMSKSSRNEKLNQTASEQKLAR